MRPDLLLLLIGAVYPRPGQPGLPDGQGGPAVTVRVRHPSPGLGEEAVSVIRHDGPNGEIVVIAACRRMGRSEATIELPDLPGAHVVQAYGVHGRIVPERAASSAGIQFSDTFWDCEVHVYELRPGGSPAR
jgi:hypothetical protein